MHQAIRIKVGVDGRFRRQLFVEMLPKTIVVFTDGKAFAEYSGYRRNLHNTLAECLSENRMDLEPGDLLAVETYSDDNLRRLVRDSEEVARGFPIPSRWQTWT